MRIDVLRRSTCHMPTEQYNSKLKLLSQQCPPNRTHWARWNHSMDQAKNQRVRCLWKQIYSGSPLLNVRPIRLTLVVLRSTDKAVGLSRDRSNPCNFVTLIRKWSREQIPIKEMNWRQTRIDRLTMMISTIETRRATPRAKKTVKFKDRIWPLDIK